jgi:hypothetical protein
MANGNMASVESASADLANTAQAAQHVTQDQLGFFGRMTEAAPAEAPRRPVVARRHGAPLCAGCRAKDARYGFLREGDDPTTERPRTLCFECFRVELGYRQDVKARLARGWNASQVPLPLEEKLNELTRRRRRAQIAARHALDL